jgi:hypothetical protein
VGFVVDNAALGQVFSDCFSSTCHPGTQCQVLPSFFAAALLLFLTTEITNKSLQEDYCLLKVAFSRVEHNQTMRRHIPKDITS